LNCAGTSATAAKAKKIETWAIAWGAGAGPLQFQRGIFTPLEFRLYALCIDLFSRL
jgi:hypothetical protein